MTTGSRLRRERLFYSVILVLFVGCNEKDTPVNDAPPVQAAVVNTIRHSDGSNFKALSALLDGKLLDLSHGYQADTIYWPTEEGFRFDRGNNGVTPKGYYYAANRFTTAEHGGTHLDAPIHFFASGETAEQISLSRLIGEAATIDVAEACSDDPDYLIGVGDIRKWEEEHQRRLENVIVLLRTGWSKHWPDREKYLGTDARGPEAIPRLHFPGLAPEAALWLVKHRSIKAIGIDTASIDYGQSSHFESHVALCSHQVPIFENLTNLDELPAEEALVIALPMKITGGSGGPLRMVAIVPPDGN